MKYAIAAIAIVAALYGYRAIMAQSPQQDFVLACTVDDGGAISCSGQLATSVSTATTIAATATPSLVATASPTSTQTVAPTATPSRTATSSPTITPTSTPVPTATNTPIPGAYNVANLLHDTTGPHDNTVCGTAGYDWHSGGKQQKQYSTGGQMTSWMVITWPCGAPRPAVNVEVRNFKGYLLYQGSWDSNASLAGIQPIGTGFGWCGATDSQTNTFASPSSCPVGGNTGPLWSMPTGTMSCNGGPGTDCTIAIHPGFGAHPNAPAGSCVVTLYEIRSSINTQLMSGGGADWWSGSSNQGAVVGSYRRVTTDWRKQGATSCPASIIQANPPPF